MMVHDLLDDAVRRWPDAPAVADGSVRLTYREVARRSTAVASWLHRQGVRRGDRVVLRLPGDADFVTLLFGALRTGAAVVPVHPAASQFHLAWILRDAAPALVVARDDDAPAMRALTAPVHDVTLVRRELAGAPSGGVRPVPATAPSDTALLMYTSGSTALPRAVVCPHDRVRFAVAAIAARLRYTAGDVVFCRSPMSFDYGLYQVFLCAEAGALLELRPRLSDAALLREIRRSGATVVPVVPTVATILHRLSTRDGSPTAVRLLTNTGAALTTTVAAGLRRAFPDAAVVPMYGMTECKRITIAEPDEDLSHPGTVGRALDGTEVTVVDDEGRPVAAGTTGEIRVRGPHVMAGYWAAPDETARRFDRPDAADRVLRTGDYGFLDASGRLYFVGRRDDIFKRNSVRTSVQEIEAAAADVPGVHAAAARPPGTDGELVVWVAGDVDPDDVLAGIAGRLDRAKVPDRCVVLPALPTGANGKVDRTALGVAVLVDRRPG
jgi:acyl-CoA synthetase (AMP-forming)/AMP-acid ligase II